MNNIILSICIPTYNRANILYKTLSNNILCKTQEIEFLISDNASTDDTETIIKKFEDPRIRYHRNKKNLGFDANVLRCAELAKGVFLFFLSDEDYLEFDSILWLIEQIKYFKNISHIIGTIWNRRPGKDESHFKFDDGFFKKGYESIKKFYFATGLISGTVLKRESLNLKQARKFIGSIYIYEVFRLQAMLNGDTLSTSKKLCSIGKDDEKTYIIMSETTPEVKGQYYYYPLSKVFLFLDRIRIIKEILKDHQIIRDHLLDREYPECAFRLIRIFDNNPRIFISKISIIIAILLKTKEIRRTFFMYVIKLTLSREYWIKLFNKVKNRLISMLKPY